MPRQIVGVRALADDDAPAGPVVVDAVVEGVVPPVRHAPPLGFAFHLPGVVGVIDHQDITLLAGDGAGDGGTGPPAAGGVLVPAFHVLVAGQAEDVAPVFAIPITLQQPAAGH